MSWDLEQNKFFISLKKKFSSCYKSARKNKCTVCVPQSSSVADIKLNRKFIEAHIVKPYPRFLNEFVSVRSDKQLVLRIEEGLISPVSGYDSTDPVKVLHEELCYNENDGSYYIFVIDRPLGTKASDGNSNHDSKESSVASSDNSGVHSFFDRSQLKHRKSMPSNLMRPDFDYSSSSKADDDETSSDLGNFKNAEWYRRLLTSDRCYMKCLADLEEEVDVFNSSFVFLGEKDDLINVSNHIRVIYDRSTQDFFHAKYLSTEEEETDLCVAIESCIVEGISAQLLRCINDQFRQDMNRLAQLCGPFSLLESTALHIDPQFDCSLQQSVECLGRIRHSVTPNDLLHTFQETLQAISVDVRNHALKRDPFGTTAAPNVSADELVPLVAKTVALTDLFELEKYLQLVQYFRFASTSEEGELSYALTTFVAAKQLIFELFPNFPFNSTDNFEIRDPKPPKVTSRKFKRHSLHFPNLPNPKEISKESTIDSPRNSSLFSIVERDPKAEDKSLQLYEPPRVNAQPSCRRPKSVLLMPDAIEIPEFTLLSQRGRGKGIAKQYTHTGVVGTTGRSEKGCCPRERADTTKASHTNVMFEQLHNDPLFISSLD